LRPELLGLGLDEHQEAGVVRLELCDHRIEHISRSIRLAALSGFPRGPREFLSWEGYLSSYQGFGSVGTAKPTGLTQRQPASSRRVFGQLSLTRGVAEAQGVVLPTRQGSGSTVSAKRSLAERGLLR
jgi:hypothetical protein